LTPVWWFGLVLAALAYFLLPAPPGRALMFGAAGLLILLMVLPARGARQFWSPYYRIDYTRESKLITVNLMGHQQMVSRAAAFPAYALPYLLTRDAGRPPISRVLIIGAGSGNDVSRALEWQASRVDAVEIDPVIYRLGQQYHPDRPYADPRVTVHLDDGRNFLRSSRDKYDLIVYALVDSLVLHSSHSNIRLESYLFTKEAFADVRDHLAPGGLFVMYNYFRHGWVVGRLQETLEETFGPKNPLVFSLPARSAIAPDQVLFDEFTVFMAGATDPIRAAFARQPEYWLKENVPPNPQTPDGFKASPGPGAWRHFSPTVVIPPTTQQRLATDDWPFLYLRTASVPALSLRGMAIMGSIAAAMIAPVSWRRRPGGSAVPGQSRGFALQMFFLGAGFMLIETKAVVHMALLFGSTWTVNSIVFFAVLVTILIANLFVLATRPVRVWPYYAGLAATLAAGALVPLDVFLGRPWLIQVAGSCVLAFAPIVFAGVVFALRFGKAAEPDRALGANVAGATFGGLAEYSSMVLGFQHLVLVALAFYALSALGGWAANPRSST
jgi:spermidine synthase